MMTVSRWTLCILVLASTVAFSGDGPLRIMPLGDSRTAGPTSATCYRLYLDRLMTASGYSFDFVGTLRGHNWDQRKPDSTFDADHEGHWGWLTDKVLWDIWTKQGAGTWARATSPDIVLLMLGTSDMLNETDSTPVKRDRTIRELAMVIDTLRSVNPRIAILLSNLYPATTRFVAPVLADALESLSVKIPFLVDSMHQDTSPVLFVDTWRDFDVTRELVDGTHANGRGSDKIARRWLEVLWPFFDTIPPAALGISGRYSNPSMNLSLVPSTGRTISPRMVGDEWYRYTLTGRKVPSFTVGVSSLPTLLPCIVRRFSPADR